MAFIRQRNKKDCGVAALAMLCDVTYEEANRSIPWRRKGNLEGITTKMLREAAGKLGYSTESTPQDRLKIVKAPKSWDPLPHPIVSDFWHLIPDNSLVKIPHPKGPGWGWHWVAWRKERIYDPARGVFHPSKYGTKPSSYMEFIKSDDLCPECGALLEAKWSGEACTSCRYTFCY
jgi:hypothetical protein